MEQMGCEPGEMANESGNGIPDRVADLVGDGPREERLPRRRRLTALCATAAQSGARAVGRGTRATGRGAQLGRRWLAGQALAMAPRLPVRDQATLRAQFAGLSPEEIADALIDGAARASAAVGAAVGAWSVLPVVPALPVQVATETPAPVRIEVQPIAH